MNLFKNRTVTAACALALSLTGCTPSHTPNSSISTSTQGAGNSPACKDGSGTSGAFNGTATTVGSIPIVVPTDLRPEVVVGQGDTVVVGGMDSTRSNLGAESPAGPPA